MRIILQGISFYCGLVGGGLVWVCGVCGGGALCAGVWGGVVGCRGRCKGVYGWRMDQGFKLMPRSVRAVRAVKYWISESLWVVAVAR